MSSDPLEIVARLKQQGYTDEQIAALLQPEAQTAQEAAPEQPVTGGETRHRFNAVQIVVGIGISLVLLAIIVVVANQWRSLSPWSKTLLVLVPNAVLYLVSLLTARDPEQAENTIALRLTAAFLVPLSVGTIFYQLGLYPAIDRYLIGWCSLLGWSLFYSLEWRVRYRQLAALTLLFLFAAVFSFWPQNLTPDQNLWLLTLGGGVMALAGWVYHFFRPDIAVIRYSIGTVLAVVFFTAAVTNNLSQLGLSQEVQAGLAILLGLIYSLLGTAFPRNPDNSPWHSAQRQLRTFFTEGGLVLSTFAYTYLITVAPSYQYGAIFLGLAFTLGSLFIPLGTLVPLGSLLLLFGSVALLSSSPYLSTYLLLFILGLILCLLTIRIKIDTYLPLGGLLIVISALVASNTLFADTLGWPVTIFILGLFLIAVGIGLRHLWRQQESDLTAYQPLVPWHSTPSKPQTGTAAHRPKSCWHFLGWIILIYLLLQMVFSLLAAALFSNY